MTGRRTTMTRLLVGIIVALCVVILATIAALVVVTVRLTEELDKTDSVTSTQTVNSNDQTADHTCDRIDDVAIVGAGIAGSYAAWRMRNAGMSISLYEYSDRIGGRCNTIHFPGIPDVKVELGAMRFKPLIHPILNRTLQDLRLEVVDFPLGSGYGNDTLFYLRGQHLRYDTLAANATYDLDPDHRKDPDTLQWEIYKNYTDVDPSVDGYTSAPNTLFYKSADGVPLYKQSRKSFYAKYFTTDTEQYIKDMGGYDSLFVDVAAAVFLPFGDPKGRPASNPIKTVKSGFQSIPETMVDQFFQASPKFVRNHHLLSMSKHQDGHYVLTFQPTVTVRGVTTDSMNLPRKHTCAKKVLLAIPRLALETLDWAPLQHPDITDILQNSLMEAKACKMFFAYGDTWWRNLTLASPYAISSTPLRQTYDYGLSPSTGRGVLMISYSDLYTEIWNDAKRQGNYVPGVDDDSLAMSNVGVNIARKIYAAVFNISVNQVQQPDYAIMRIWDQYPFGASWYIWRSGYIWEDVENRMTRPSLDDDVFIISNTFSRTSNQGWVEGALEIVENTFRKYFPDV